MAKGQKLVLLDDMVLDMTDYIDKHPGGRFAMQANIGRDVSKYFHGGYSLENQGDFKIMPHTHSNDARKIVNKFAIAYLDKEANKRLMKIGEVSNANQSQTAKTI